MGAVVHKIQGRFQLRFKFLERKKVQLFMGMLFLQWDWPI